MRQSFLCVVVLLCVQLKWTNGSQSTSCPDDWLTFHGSCYHFGNDELTFVAAEQYCRERGGHLVHVDNAAENSYLKGKIITMIARKWWLGLTDTLAEGSWEWHDTGVAPEFTDFRHGDGGDHITEDCAVYNPDRGYLWTDYSCTSIHYPLCEMPSRQCADASIIG